MCGTCLETRLVTRFIAGTRDAETKKKLLTISPFPSLQVVVNICRSEKLAHANKRTLSGQSGLAAFRNKSGKSDHRHECCKCGRPAHLQGVIFPVVSKHCHACGKPDHFPHDVLIATRRRQAGTAEVGPERNQKWPISPLASFRLVIAALFPDYIAGCSP